MLNKSANICPYPGLRPFTIEESLYFKGRDKHIDRIKLELEKRGFLMVTGASGDGKSSLIFAGLIPNIRAGFLKAKYNQWKTVVFRPGNDPLANFAEALTPQLGSDNPVNIKTSLGLGYSALTDLYKSSDLFVERLDKKDKDKKRMGANLLIVVDQFEEFFTNKENFDRETAMPSQNAQTVVNLLIETTIASKQNDLPIYIVCTMRSDYIGNTPVFRGLPELIGKNQFFVPRLNRAEILDAITEPSVLSGNKISVRLAQRMLNDIGSINTDALPVLQHALRQVWQMADSGGEEMDLWHYCGVGGMIKEDLPEDERKKFDHWFENQPETKKDFYKQQSKEFSQNLNNVLNLHANILYETAHEYYNSNLERKDAIDRVSVKLTKNQAQLIIKTAFKCLTKIDDSRAVRNRITLQEITGIIDDKECDHNVIIGVLNIFREQGNTLIYPFITNEPSSRNIDKTSLLDITHEALIRNWKKLSTWTKKEHESANVFRELSSHVKRWENHEKSRTLLLPGGTFTHYDSWYDEQQPNSAWIARYVENEVYMTDGIMISPLADSEEDTKVEAVSGIDPENAMSMETYNSIRDFLTQSKDNIQRIQRIRKIAMAVITGLMIIAFIGFFWAMKLKEDIRITAKSNLIATKASMQLENDPTLSFRLAEQAYKIYPTDLAKQVIMASYGKMPFYKSLKGFAHAKFSPDGKYILTASNSIWLYDRQGKELQIMKNIGVDIFNDHYVNFSSEGRYIGLAKSGNKVSIYDIPENKWQTLQGHSGVVNSVCFSSDGKYILTASDDKTVRLWDINYNEIRILKGHTKSVRFAKFSPDCKYILSASDDNTVRFWDLAGNQLKILEGMKFGEKYNANFSPDGNYIVTTSYDNIARLWNLTDNAVVLLKGHSDVIWSAYFSPDGKYILTSSIDNTARLWDLHGKELLVYKGHTAKLWDAKFSPDGRHIISISDDCTARLWDLEGHTLQILKGHASQILNMNFSPDGKYVATAGNDGTTLIWNIKPKENPVLRGHFSWLEDANFSPDGNYIVTAGYDYVARIWSKEGYHVKALKGHQHYFVKTAKFSPDGQYIITASGDNTVRLWNPDGEELVVFKGHTNRVLFADFSFDGNYLLTKSPWWDSSCRLWDLKGNEIKVFNNAADASFSPDSKFFIVSFKDSIPIIYKLARKGAMDSISLFYKITEQIGTFSSVKFSPNGDNIVSVINGSTVVIWKFNESDANVVRLIKIIKNKFGFSILDGLNFVLNFSSNGKYFITTSSDNVARIYDMNGEEILTLAGHSDRINSANFSPDGKYMVTGSNDFTVRIWDMQGNQLQVLPNHTSAVMKVSFSNDGKYVLSASIDQTARLMPWRVEDVLYKINEEKVRGEVWELSEEDKRLYGVVE